MKSAVLEKPATKVKFVCPAGYNLVLTPVSAGQGIEVEGHYIPLPFHHINFRKEGYLPPGIRAGHGFWRGVFVTDKPEEIEYIRKHEWFREGPPPEPRYENGLPVNESAGGATRLIYEVPYDPDEKPQPGPKQIIRRGDKEDQPTEPIPPAETTPPPTRARIAKGIKRS